MAMDDLTGKAALVTGGSRGIGRASALRNLPQSGYRSQKNGGVMAISKELLEILACPQCKGDIRLTDKEDGLICDKCKLLYEIKDDIPIMLIEEAKPLR